MRSGDDTRPSWRRYLRFFRENPRSDVNEELAFHLQSAIDELVAAGMTRDDAESVARRKFGDMEGISRTLYTLSERQESSMERRERWQTVKGDVAFGLRQLRKSPGFTLVALLTLALGIGANSAIFSVVYAVMLAPLPFAHSDRIISIGEATGQGTNAVTFGNYATWKQDASSLEAIGAFWGGGTRTMTGVGDPTPIVTYSTTASYWRVQFMPPVIGRYFKDGEDAPGGSPVAVLSYGLWQTRFNGDRNVLGKTITLSGTAYTIVGVAPAEYVMVPPAEQVWLPMKVDPRRWSDHSDHELTVVGLVKPGIGIGEARQQLSTIERGLAKQYPNSGFVDVDVKPMADELVGADNRTLLFTLIGAVGLVLLIACANVANLLVARANVRRAEIAIRGALGASRGRIVTQLLVESLLLAGAGGALGLAVAWAGVRFLVTSPAAMPRLHDATLSWPVVLFTLALSVGCAVVFGLVPAVRAARFDLQQTLRDGGRESAGTTRERLRGLLVVGELCLCQVLLVGAALLIRSAMRVQAVPPGFTTHNVLITNVLLPGRRYDDGAKIEGAFRQLDAAIAAVPGVTAVGRTLLAPVQSGGMWNCAAMRPGSNGHDDGAITANMRSANDGYFSALGVPLVRGRYFNNTDVAAGAPVAIVTRSLARALYGDADPIGRTVAGCAGNSKDGVVWRQIVGVVADTRARGLTADPPPEMYMPSAQWADNTQMAYLVRAGVPVETLVPSIRRAVASVDPELALSRTTTMDDALAKTRAVPRFTMWLLGLLGATGLVLAVVGVYGVISYFVAQRRHEFGVRIALGASGGSLERLVLREGVLLGVFGVLVGTGVALVLARFLEAFVFGITTHDPVAFAAVAVLLAAIATIASYIPARRATRISPLEAIRST